MRVVCAQIEVVGGDLAGNVDRATAAIEAATADDADLVVLPELFTVGYFSIDSFVRRAESLAGPTLTRLAETAASQGVALLAGTFVEDLAATAAETEAPVPEADGLANTAVLFDAAGERRAVSRRLDLPGYGTGSGGPDTGSPGIATLRFGGESVTVGLTTGADLWLPGIYRDLADRGCELVCVPAAWPYPHVEQWAVLARARAIENGSYLAAANGSGESEEATLLGRSTVYDPRGTPLSSAGDDPALVPATLDPASVDRVRDSLPAPGDHRSGES
jgi:predicted amidohydrolase